MPFKRIPDDLIFLILDFSWNEYDLQQFGKINKRTKKLIDNYGTIRELNCCVRSNMTNFINNFIQNRRSIRVLHMCRIQNPIIWIPCEWPEIVEFMGCDLNKSKISPPVLSKNTKELIIRDSYTCRINIENLKEKIDNPIWIDFSKLPNLEVLKIRTISFDCSCLKLCKGLKLFEIDLIPFWSGNKWDTTSIKLPKNFKENTDRMIFKLSKGKKRIL